MYVLKAKPKICPPHRSQTDEPRNTQTGMGHLGLDLTPSARNGSDRFTEAGATRPPFHVDFFLLFSFLFLWPGYSPNRWTDVDGWWLKRRVLARGSAFWGSRDHVIKTVGVAPQKPHFGPFWQNEIRGWDWTRTDVQPRLIILSKSTRAQMMRITVRYQIIWNEAPQLQ